MARISQFYQTWPRQFPDERRCPPGELQAQQSISLTIYMKKKELRKRLLKASENCLDHSEVPFLV